MEWSELLRFVAGILESLKIDDFVTGSAASMNYSEPRLTNDIEIVDDLPQSQIAEFCAAFPAEQFYVCEDAACKAVYDDTTFNIVHPAGGLKVDGIVASVTDFNMSRFHRAVRSDVLVGQPIWMSSPEDVIMSKLRVFRLGESDQHLRDIAGDIRVCDTHRDREYIRQRAERFRVAQVREKVLQQAAG